MASTEYWRGVSGQVYAYQVERMPFTPPPFKDGNYIFARQRNGIWYAVYVGQGDLQDRYGAAIREGCVIRKGATHYHWHENNSLDGRRTEERDVIKGNPECEGLNGCNGKD